MFDTIGTPGLWAAFAAFVVVALAIDLWVMDRRTAQTVSVKAAVVWSIVWIALAASRRTAGMCTKVQTSTALIIFTSPGCVLQPAVH